MITILTIAVATVLLDLAVGDGRQPIPVIAFKRL
ncbi:hypothetical protein FHW03_002407 [Ochrobactrum sp. RH2CCR150]|nr:hypothetical protein [Ochrobactrum sp. RH2CCR150]